MTMEIPKLRARAAFAPDHFQLGNRSLKRKKWIINRIHLN